MVYRAIAALALIETYRSVEVKLTLVIMALQNAMHSVTHIRRLPEGEKSTPIAHMTKTKPKPKRRRILPDEDRKERQIVVRMTEEEYAPLEALADRQGLPVSYFVRQAIQSFVAKKRDK
jgi:hypothetical protein